LQERNRAVQAARDALQAVDDLLVKARAEIQRQVDAMDGLITVPRKRKAPIQG
jgi:hypothetical protein